MASKRLCVVGLIVMMHVAHAYPAEARIRWVCEEWRDYYYIVATGEFIGWAGEPYEFCYYEGEPVTYPESPFPDRYGGGLGIPQSYDECGLCTFRSDRCLLLVSSGVNRCIEGQQRYHRWWCVSYRRQRFDQPMGTSYQCDAFTGTDPITNRPIRETVCSGPAIDECVESFRRDYLDTTVENSVDMNLGVDFFEIGAEHTVSVSWGGRDGFESACRHAGAEAESICANRLNTCNHEAGCDNQ